MATKTKFSWKRKSSENLRKVRAVIFTEDSKEDHEPFVNDWRALSKRSKIGFLEDSIIKSDRLKNDGIALAQLERYWESISKWSEAIQLTPENEVLHEMKAQVLLELNEIFPAVQAAEMAVSLNPRWHVSLQTLGRAQLGMGEVDMAIKSFSKAVHIKPDSKEILNEDLRWAVRLKKEKLKDNKSTKHQQPNQEINYLDQFGSH